MKVALVHDWLTSMAGAEKALQAIYDIFPAPIHTLMMDRKKMAGSFFADKEVITSFIQKFPFVEKKYRSYLPFFPMAIEQFNFSSYDLILSTSHCVAKGVIPESHQRHICYCCTPMRYAWDLCHSYLKDAKLTRGIKGILAKWFLHYLRMWDLTSCHRVDEFVAISHFVKQRIKRVYGREASVIYPPVDVDFYALHPQKEDYYVTASRLVPYKRVDLIVEAFASLPDKKLVVIGDGPEAEAIKKRAPKNVEFLGYQSDSVLREVLQKAKTFLFAAVEDFGILPVEAMSCGTPVIAYRQGGAKETVMEGITGEFFQEQTPESLREKILEFEHKEYDPCKIRAHAETFSVQRFQKEFKELVCASLS